MGYVESLLSKGEDMIVRSRQHWVSLLASILINGFIVVLVLVLYIVLDKLLKPVGVVATAIGVVALIGVLFGLVRFGWDLLQWWAEEYIVSTRRVIQPEGIINKRTADSSLEKVNDVVLVQSFFGRILGYGNLEIVTGSDIGVNLLTRLREPIAFKTAMLDQKAQLGHEFGEVRPPEQAPDGDVPKMKSELDDLRKRGL